MGTDATHETHMSMYQERLRHERDIVLELDALKWELALYRDAFDEILALDKADANGQVNTDRAFSSALQIARNIR